MEISDVDDVDEPVGGAYYRVFIKYFEKFDKKPRNYRSASIS